MLDPKQKSIQAFNIEALGSRKLEMKILPHGKYELELTSAGQSDHWQIGRHCLAGNSYFPCGRIFIASISDS